MAVLIRVLLLTASVMFPAVSTWLNALNAQCRMPAAEESIECAIQLHIQFGVER